jgi:hypothetical protein
MLRLRSRAVLVAVLSSAALALAPADHSAAGNTAGYEFSGTAALPAGWSYATAKGCTSSSNVWVSGGVVSLQVGPVGTHPYCGARIGTKKTFHPPFTITVRARYQLPAGVHTGPTMYGADGDPWPMNGEVDLGEMTANSPTYYHVRVWTQNTTYTTPQRCGLQFDMDGLDTTQWHTYGAVVTTDSLTFVLDGTAQYTVTQAAMAQKSCSWPFNQPAGLRIFLTASSGGWGGTPTGPGYPAIQQFDYVRVS